MRSFYCKLRLTSDLRDSILQFDFCHFVRRKICVCSTSEASFATEQCSTDSKTLILEFRVHHTTLIFLGDLDIILSRACISY